MLKIELRLKPTLKGKEELAAWPDQNFTPDFIVASSGLARFEINSMVVGVSVSDHKPCVTPTDHLNAKGVNVWLPDYLGGFALNLAEAAVRFKHTTTGETSAKFIDQPLDLHLQHLPDAKDHTKRVEVSFRHGSTFLTRSEGATVTILAEIARTLQDFVAQLLELNPRLAEQPDVAKLRGQIAELVA